MQSLLVENDELARSISIDQRHSDRWVNILKDQRLMKHAHYEDDAQAWHALET